MIGYLCKSLRIISLVWPTRLIFLAMGEVLSFGFKLAVLDPSDRKGNDMYCIVAKTLIPTLQLSVSTRSHLGACSRAPPEGASIMEGFYIITIAPPMKCE